MDCEGGSDGNLMVTGTGEGGNEGKCVQVKLQLKSSGVEGLRAEIMGQTFWFQIPAPALIV